MFKYWWVPLLTLFLGLAIATVLVLAQPPTYVSKASMVETVKLRLPEGSLFAEDVQTSVGTQTELLKSKALGSMALAWIAASSNGVSALKGPDGEALPVELKVSGTPKSSVFGLQATSSDAAYVRAYLDALLNVYLEYKRNMRRVVSGDTLASLTEQIQRVERDLRAEQDLLRAFQQTNNPVVLRAQEAVAVDCLKRLNAQLSDLQLEESLSRRFPASQTDASALEIIQFKIEHTHKAVTEWESKLAENTNPMYATERLQQNVKRSEILYERLVQLLQNFALERNLSLETLAILEPASPAARTYTRERATFVTAGSGGLGVGFGVLALIGVYGRIRNDPANKSISTSGNT
jgi:uncharacterized protein involved in exopolysaccharide biosynthesis